ncbi:MAG: hypothetical protein AAGJ11_18255 [Bacteroidota bacterium]
MDDFTGTWALAAYGFSREGGFSGSPSAYQRAIADFLVGQGGVELAPAEGLGLSVEPSGRFTQTQSEAFTGYVYDADGVETSRGVFDGTLREADGAAYLHPDRIPVWAEPTGRYAPPPRIRLDDGDTVVCDWVRRDGDALVRTISVVTDGAYPSRAVLRYRRLGAE